MKYSKLKDKHNKLEKDVFTALITEITKSDLESRHVQEKAIRVNVFGYEELVLLNGALTFIDESGMHYGVYSECSLEDLIDILSQI